MFGAFGNRHTFNEDLSDWNTSSVTSMAWMFSYNFAFNQDISNWDISSLVNMGHMFRGAHAFNQNLGDWNITSVSDLSSTFLNTHALSDSNKGEIHKTFASNPNWEYDWRPYVVIDDTNFQVAVNLWFDNQAEANATYGHISDWNTSAVTNMSEAFEGSYNI